VANVVASIEPAVDPTYVHRLLAELQDEQRGLHTKMNELELLRHYEDPIQLPSGEKASGLEVRIGAASELIENVKASLTSNEPNVVVQALREGNPAQDNSSKRESFWTQFLLWIGKPVAVKAELVDAQAGLGLGILKGVYYPWPKDERKRLRSEPKTKEGNKSFRDRVKALKRKWGPPFRVFTIHPLTFYFRLGPGNQLVETLEHSWKPKSEVYPAFGLEDKQLDTFPDKLNQEIAEAVAATPGQPDQTIRPLAAGLSEATMVLVTEYRRDKVLGAEGVYQVYVNGRLVYQEVGDPSVQYFLCLGRTTSSKDPDKFGISVAESFRHNEPLINRALTRMGEAVELLVRKRLTLEVPEGFTPETEIANKPGEDNQPQPKTYKFSAEKATALPAGSKIVDPFANVADVFGAMPYIQILMDVMSQHGVSPIFKGESVSSASSGFNSNSLFMMAKSQFQYLTDSYSGCLVSLIEWLEGQVVTRARQEIWVGDVSLRPKDIEEWPVTIRVDIDPLLPQNLIAEGQFYDRMHSQGHITERTFLEKGLRMDQPEAEIKGRMLEDLQNLLLPTLYQDVLQTVGAIQPQLVGPDGKPVQSQGNGAVPSGNSAGVIEALQSLGGRTRQGQPRQPPEASGSTPGLEQL